MLSLLSILMAVLLGFTLFPVNESASGVIGGADGPTSVIISDDVSAADSVVDDAAAHLQELACDNDYILFSSPSTEARELIDRYASVSGTVPVARYDITEDWENVMILARAMMQSPLSGTGEAMLSQAIYAASTVVSLLTAQSGDIYAVAASSILRYFSMNTFNLPSSMHLLEYENGVGIVVGIWNDGTGLNLVTAGFVPDASAVRFDQLLSLLVE